MTKRLRVAGLRNAGRPKTAETKAKAWPIIVAIVSQTTILVALLYRIGWIRANATADYFGLDVTLLGLAPSDYLQRSLNSLVRPLLVFLLGTIVFYAIAPRLARSRGRFAERALRTARPVGGVLLLVGVLGVLVDVTPEWPEAALPPLAIFAGAGTLGYVTHLARSRAGRESGSHLLSVTLLGLSLIGLLLTVERYAEHVGRTIAVNDAQALLTRPEIRLHSTRKLDISGTGISLGYDASPEQDFHYRYDGLRLLVYSNNRFVLVSRQWEHGKSKVFIVKDNDSVRIDVTAPPDR
ncbi:hypothetical protein [Amycolatopsis sp. NPDC051071]|uniref:hypothetical protein n=1 Tax=Amycolatopsis sp. NPDC051071 TaxID=3154637 RepID=UPI00343819A4